MTLLVRPHNYLAKRDSLPIPTDNLVEWWRADDSAKIQLVGNKVSSWTGYNGTVASQSNDNLRPFLETNVQNGLNGIKFSEFSSDTFARYLDHLPLFSSPTTDFTFYYIIKHINRDDSGFVNRFHAGAIAGANTDTQLRTSSSNAAGTTIGRQTGGTIVVTEAPTPISALVYTFNNNDIYKNNVINTPYLQQTVPVSVKGLQRFGTSIDDVDNSRYLGYILEVIIYNTTHDIATSNQIFNYGQSKWGIIV